MRRAATVAMAIAAAAGVAGCERYMRDMVEQPRVERGEPSPLLDAAVGVRPGPVAATVMVALGDLAGTSSGRRGREALARLESAMRRQDTGPVTRDLLSRGRERFDIFCSPCHSITGDGDGRVVQRGFPAPPTFHQARLRAAPDRHFYDVISRGYGIMTAYADRVAPPDRWAIVAWIRTLQLSRHAPLAAVPAHLRERLAGTAVAPGDAGVPAGRDAAPARGRKATAGPTGDAAPHGEASR